MTLTLAATAVLVLVALYVALSLGQTFVASLTAVLP